MTTGIVRFIAAALTAGSCLSAADAPQGLPSLTIKLQLDHSVIFSIDNRVIDVLGNPIGNGLTGWTISSLHIQMRDGFVVEEPNAFFGPLQTNGDPVVNAAGTGLTLNFRNPIDTELGGDLKVGYKNNRDPRLHLATFQFDTPDKSLHDFEYSLLRQEVTDGTYRNVLFIPRVPDSANLVCLLGLTTLGLFALHRWRAQRSADRTGGNEQREGLWVKTNLGSHAATS